jgi:hypothetical protein
MPGLTKGVFGKKSLLFGKLVAEWPHIAGAELAAHTIPLALKFQRAPQEKAGQKDAAQAVLQLAIKPAFALEFSYQKALLIERLNVFFGYPAIKDIKIVQDSRIMDRAAPPKAKSKPLTLQQQQHIDSLTNGIQENDLQTALKNLGKAIASRQE